MKRNAPLLDRLAARTEFSDDCWVWVGTITRYGYGEFYMGRGTRTHAHRAVWEAVVGEIPEGLEPDHLCRNRACVNPDHIEIVTPRENTRRARWLETRCPNGHLYPDELALDFRGRRACRACARERHYRYLAKGDNREKVNARARARYAEVGR